MPNRLILLSELPTSSVGFPFAWQRSDTLTMTIMGIHCQGVQIICRICVEYTKFVEYDVKFIRNMLILIGGTYEIVNI